MGLKYPVGELGNCDDLSGGDPDIITDILTRFVYTDHK